MASQEQDMDVSLIDLMTSEGVGGDSLKLLSKKHLEKNRHPSANVLFDLNEDEKPKPVTANTDEEPICNRLIEVQVPPKSYRIRGVAVAVGVSAGILVVVDILHATMNKAVTTVLVTVIASIAMLVMTEIRNWKKVAAAAATATEGLSGQPKVAKHVREAKDLLIKIIAKETSELQRELSSQAKEEGAPQRRLINMSQVGFHQPLSSTNAKLLLPFLPFSSILLARHFISGGSVFADFRSVSRRHGCFNR